MPIPHQYSDIVSRTVESTKAGRVRWQESPGGSDFFVVFKKFSLAVWPGESYGGELEVSIGIRNEQGEMIDSFSVAERDSEYPMVQELYVLARRSARRIDEAIAEITVELDGDEDIGGHVPRRAVGDDLEPPPPSDDGIPF